MSTVYYLTLCLFTISSIAISGLAILRALNYEETPLALSCVAVGWGATLHGLMGFLVARCGGSKHHVALALLGINILVCTAVILRKGGIQYLKESYGVEALTAGLIWLAASFFTMSLCLAPVKLPKVMADGAYIFKHDSLNVRIQKMTGDLPVDNFIPFIVSKYLLDDISFKKERPIVPGQEVSNRPILMSLAFVPFGAAEVQPVRQKHKLPRFSYVGTVWPDTGALGDDAQFAAFLAVAVPLNAAVVLPLLLLVKLMNIWKWRYWVAAVFVTNLYVVFQTAFTWPKMLAGFFLLTGGCLIFFRRRRRVGSAMFALAFWSHPYSQVFIFSLGIWLMLETLRKRITLRDFSCCILIIAAFMMPWYVWTRIVLNIPSNLIEQNMTGGILSDMIWMRLCNAYRALFPIFFESPVLDWQSVIVTCTVCLPGAMGIALWPFAGAALCNLEKDLKGFGLYFIALPAALLIGVFSYPAVPIVHGFQALVPALVVLAVARVSAYWKPATVMALFIVQIFINAIMLISRVSYVCS